MTATQWLTQARRDRDVLRSLIDRFHPQNRRIDDADGLLITAPVPESACRAVRKEIREECRDQMLTPGVRFDAALADGNWGSASVVLSETWFGVPESSECWGVDGFAECVDLLDDPPSEGER